VKQKNITRRGFLGKLFNATAIVIGVPLLSSAQNSDTLIASQETRTLFFKIPQVRPDGKAVYNEEAHAVTYYDNGTYDQDALDEINELLRDPKKNLASPRGTDKKLIDLLYKIRIKEEALHPDLIVVFYVISGYRDPKTNEELRTDPNYPFAGGVAKNSLHTHAKAIDIFVPEISGKELRDTAWCMGEGGIGWYPQYKNMFPYRYIHVDSGRVHHWGFNPQTIRCPEVH
jgi:uncharacterized protein YcbK (DUF882 family)